MKIQSGLSNGQVLQRLGKNGKDGANVTLSGTIPGGKLGDGAGGAEIFATISAKTGAAFAPLKGWNQRRVGKITLPKKAAKTGGELPFQITLTGIPTGGPYRLQLACGGATVRVAAFYVGDVWLMAGQSNMEGVGRMTGAAKPHPLIRALSMRREWRQAADPLHVLSESPDRCHHDIPVGAPIPQVPPQEGERFRATTAKGVGVGVFFAREMLERNGVPQGLIATAHGGTSMEQWSPEQWHALPKNLPADELATRAGESLYGSMMLSLRATGQPIAGVLWYQGESDTQPRQVAVYAEKMRELVAALRRDLRQPALPWIIAQIGRVAGIRADREQWNAIQEQQRRLPGRIRRLLTVATVDLPLDDGIHLSSRAHAELARRMALAAETLAASYANGSARRSTPPPSLKMIRAGGASLAPDAEPNLGIDIVYENVGENAATGSPGGLRSGSEPTGFTILDAQGNPWPGVFKTTLHGNIVRLHLSMGLPAGARLSYGHGHTPACNITDARGHALPVFGPLPCERPGLLPFVRDWHFSDVIPAGSPGFKPLEALSCPTLETFLTRAGKESVMRKTFPESGFVEDHARWLARSGIVFFWGEIELPAPLKADVLLGYDGPFRLWLDGKPFHLDPHGANPCLPDETSKPAALKAGRHTLTVAMDTNGGRSWGFFLRLARRG